MINLKKILMILVVGLMTTPSFAQNDGDYIELLRSVLSTEKRAAVAENMNLSDQESDLFWPLYDEYESARKQIQTKRIKLINDFAMNYETMTDDKADELATSYLAFKKELLALDQKYYKKFKKIMPAGKVAKYYQIENKIGAMVDYELADAIPFIETR